MRNKISILIAGLILTFGFTACTDDDNFRFQTNEEVDQIAFLNEFLPEYVLSEETANNNAERFIWATPDFGVPTAINYVLETSQNGTFEDDDLEVVATSTETNASVSIGDMLSLANDKGLSNSQLEDEEGNPIFDENEEPVFNNEGELFFRVRADLGDNAENTPEAVSEVTTLNVRILIETEEDDSPEPSGDCEFDQLWIVGAGVPDAGWGWDSPVQLLCTGDNVYSGNVLFDSDGDGNFRFFTNADEQWSSPSYNFPYFVEEGFTIDPVFEDAEDGDNNFLFTGETGVYFLEIDFVNQTITVGPEQVEGNCDLDQLWLVGAGVPDAGWGWDSPVQLPCTGDNVYSGNVNFSPDNDGNFRFFEDADLQWDSPSYNFPYFADDSFTIDPLFQDAEDGDNNFQFIGDAGTYFLTVDMENKTITLE